MSWLIKKGDEIKSDQVIDLPFIVYERGAVPSRGHCTTDLIISDAEHAPRKYSGALVGRDHVVCTLDMDLTEVQARKFKKRRNTAGVAYNTLNHTLGLMVTGGGLTFTGRVDGRILGSVNATFA